MRCRNELFMAFIIRFTLYIGKIAQKDEMGIYKLNF